MGQRTPFGTYTNEPSVNTAEFNAAKKLSRYGTTVPKYSSMSAGYFCTASENEQKITPASANFSLKVVATETLSNTASTATPDNNFCSCRGMPNLLYVSNNFGSTSSKFFNFATFDLGAE